jgi:EmrB/QacA subfamily drug resistance transporter
MKTSSMTEKLPEEQEKRTDRWRWVALVVVSMAIFLDALDVSIVNVALPSIQRDLHLTTTELQWVPGVYVLTYAGLMLLGGRAADLLGRRRIFLLGATLFGLASLTGGLAPSGWLLILARGAQGIGAALTFPSAFSILTTTFAEGPQRNKALGIFNAMGGAGFTCGLVLGGVLTTFISWHWVFFVNVPAVLLILLLARLVVPQGRSMEHSRSYDLAGAVTVTAGLLLLVYAMTQANEGGATPPGKTAGLFALALFFLICFVLIERRSKAPLMPLHIWRSRTLGAASAATFTLLGTFFSFLFICTLYLQKVLHSSPVNASLALLPASTVSVLVGLFLAPWFMNRLGVRCTAGLGLLSLLSGILLFLRIGASADYVGIILPSTILALGLGMGLAGPTLAVAAVSGIKPTEQGLAAGLLGTVGQAGGGLGLAITATVLVANTAPQGAAPTVALSVLAQLSGFHAGLLVIAAGAALGVLIALVGIKMRSGTPSSVSKEEATH